MADIKLNKREEPVAPLNEKPAVGLGRLKESLENFEENSEKRNIETAGGRPAVNERVVMENMTPVTIGPLAGLTAPQIKRQKQVEKVLAEGLEDIYLSLTPEKQKEFKRTGEETAAKINKLLAKAKVSIGAIVKLIRKWLALIPGVNKYFLDQEAKIKADKIIKMKNENIKM